MNQINKILLEDPRIFAYLSSNGNFKIYPHIDLIFQKFINIEKNEIKNLLIEMPPRHGKTESCIYFISYYLKKYNNKNIIYCTYGAELSYEKTRKIKDIINNTPFAKIKKDYSSMRRFETENGNFLFSVGIFGSITGRGANLLIIDDLIKNQEEAQNEKYMDKIFDYFKYVLYTRLLPESHIIIINTRWHKNDFSNFIRENYSKEFDFLSLPAINENNIPLCEKLFSLDKLREIEKNIGYEAFQALYQQNPLSASNKFFNEKYFKYFTIKDNFFYSDNFYFPIESMLKFFVIDTASSKTKTSDYFVLLVVFVDNSNHTFFVDYYRDKIEFVEHEKVIESFYLRYNPHFILIEKNFVGIATFQLLKKKGYPVHSIIAKENKILRAEHPKIFYQNGLIYHNKDMKNLYDFENELLSFPNSKHDDIVDCVSYAVIKIKQKTNNNIFSMGKIY